MNILYSRSSLLRSAIEAAKELAKRLLLPHIVRILLQQDKEPQHVRAIRTTNREQRTAEVVISSSSYYSWPAGVLRNESFLAK